VKLGNDEQISISETREKRMIAEAIGIYFDYSKHRITDEICRLLLQLVEESGLRVRIEAKFRGEKINITETTVGRSLCQRTLKTSRGTVTRG
jgi:glucose-6-phosphate isomerase